MRHPSLLIALLVAAPLSLAHADGPAAGPLSTFWPNLPGAPVLVDPVADLADHPDFNIDSWFVSARVTTEQRPRHELYLLAHQLYIKPKIPGVPKVIIGINSIYDRTTGEYVVKEYPYSEAEVSIAADKLSVLMPNTQLTGGPAELAVKGTLDTGGFDLKMVPTGPVLFNNSNGAFPLLEGENYQIALPRMATTGSVTLHGTTYAVSGEAWLDRQWANTDVMKVITNQFRWTWFNIKFDHSDDVLSVWDIIDQGAGREHAWVTALSPDRTTVVAPVVPLARDASRIFVSPTSGQRYPTRFLVRIPSLDTVLEIESLRADQEVPSFFQPKYEGAAKVRGVYKGRFVTGKCFIEMVGNWQN